MFRILLVDDNPINLHLLQQVLKTFPRPCHVDSVKDGSAALEFLSSRRCDAKASLPHLILMDLNMPRVNGLQALAALKADSELRCIPVIMASTAALPTQVRKSYQAHASCFVRKTTTLEESERLLRGILTFWMEFAVSPLVDDSAVVYGNLDVHPDSGL